MEKGDKNEIWLCRHAHSYFNMWDDWHEGRLKNSDLSEAEVSFCNSIENKFDRKLVDPILSHIGVSQCIEAQEFISTLPIQYVLVSPIQRTLETARLLFEKHPNLKNIEFIVLPIIREIMANPDDIPCFTLDRMMPKYKKLENYNFDFSLVETARDKTLYWLETMDESAKIKITQELEKQGIEKYPELVLDVMKEKHKTSLQHYRKIESFENGRKRCHVFTRWVTEEFMKNKGITGKNIMVVSHSVYLSHLIAQEFNDYGKAVCHKIVNAKPFLFDLNSIVKFQ